MKALGYCLKDYSTAVRDAAIGSLGQIGLPESLLALDNIIDCIEDEDVGVKSKAIWVIGRLARGCNTNVSKLNN